MVAPKRRVVIPSDDVATAVGVVGGGARIPVDLSGFGHSGTEAADRGPAGRLCDDQRVNLCEQFARAARIPARPVVEHPIGDDVLAIGIALEQRRNVAQDDRFVLDAGVFVGAAVVVLRITAGRRLDRMRSMALPIEQDSGNARVHDADRVGLQRPFERTLRRRRPVVEDRRV